MADVNSQSDNAVESAPPIENVTAAPEVADTRAETNSFVPPDARTDTSAAAVNNDFQIVDDTGAVLAGNDTAPVVQASLKDNALDATPDGAKVPPEEKLVEHMFNNVENFAFNTNGDNFFNAKEGKQSLEALAQLANMSGPEGLTKLTDALNTRAAEKFGNQAFDASDPKVADKMEGSAVQMEIKKQTANSMELQFNFLVPNSNEIRSHKFNLDTTPGQAPRPVFDRTTAV
jgi:hypothetical protein